MQIIHIPANPVWFGAGIGDSMVISEVFPVEAFRNAENPASPLEGFGSEL